MIVMITINGMTIAKIPRERSLVDKFFYKKVFKRQAADICDIAYSVFNMRIIKYPIYPPVFN